MSSCGELCAPTVRTAKPNDNFQSNPSETQVEITDVALVGSTSIKSAEAREIERFVRQNRTLLLEAWNAHFGR